MQGGVVLLVQHKETRPGLIRSFVKHKFDDVNRTLSADHVHGSGIVSLLHIQPCSVTKQRHKKLAYTDAGDAFDVYFKTFLKKLLKCRRVMEVLTPSTAQSRKCFHR